MKKALKEILVSKSARKDATGIVLQSAQAGMSWSGAPIA